MPSPNGERQPALDFTGESKAMPRDDRQQLLSFSGGGYRGLFSARLIEHMEESIGAGQRIRSRFKLIAGTSIGAVIAAAVAAEIPASKIREAMESAGPKIFARRGVVSKLKQLFWKAPYTRKYLESTLEELFTTAGKQQLLDTPIQNVNLPLVLTAVSASTHQPMIFTARNLSLIPHPNIKLRDAILASAAAPTYFPALKTKHHTLVDGGLIANAPDVIALAILHRKIGVPMSSCYCMSIGTASPRVPAKKPQQKSSGAFGWIVSRRGLVKLTLDAQEQLAIQTMELLLGDRFCRMDADPFAGQSDVTPELDRADIPATNLLKQLADNLWLQREHDPLVRAFL